MVVTSKNILVARRLLETMLTEEESQDLIPELLKTATYYAEQRNEPFNFVGETFEVSIDLRAGVIVKGIYTVQEKSFKELQNDDG